MSENEMPDKNQILFMQLLINFQSVAWQALGKMKNPVTDTIERNMEQARYAIDMIEMLRQKTQNNVDENEKRFMESLLRDLQLNYVDEAKKDEQKESESPSEEKVKASEKADSGKAESVDEKKADPAPKKTTKRKTAAKKGSKKS